jgi:hypothetical protein
MGHRAGMAVEQCAADEKIRGVLMLGRNEKWLVLG